MLTLVEITNPRGDTLQLPLSDSSTGYAVKDIQGLGPVAAALTSSSMAQMDGAQAQNARRDIRNITMSLGLEPDYVTNTVQSLRTDLYDYLMPKMNILMKFYLDGIIFGTCLGQVESCDPSIFSADPTVDVSIICNDPDFYGITPEELDANTVSTTDVQVISYEGSSETGIVLEIAINRSLLALTVYNTAPDNSAQIFSITGSFAAGDILTLNTIPGKKSLILTRAGIESSAFSGVDETSNWITLSKGDNNFRVYATGAAIPYTVTYLPKFGGI
jgi:hypothetical protein